jgi:hypothetical protein
MRSISKSVSILSVCALTTVSPLLISGAKSNAINYTSSHTINTVPNHTIAVKENKYELINKEAISLYEEMDLKKFGLGKKAFEYAWRGYQYLLNKGKLDNPEVISICDFSQSSRKRRLYIIDVEEKKILLNTFVAHGRNSGGEYARSFSNNPESHKSSLGFYVTRSTYYGEHGLALKIDGLERGFNDRANARNIVIHGSEYVGSGYLRENKFNGRSFGCPAVPAQVTDDVINIIKNGSCLFIYHPSKNYLTRSRILNG